MTINNLFWQCFDDELASKVTKLCVMSYFAGMSAIRLINFYKQRRCLIDIDGNLTPEAVSQSIREKLSLAVQV